MKALITRKLEGGYQVRMPDAAFGYHVQTKGEARELAERLALGEAAMAPLEVEVHGCPH